MFPCLITFNSDLLTSKLTIGYLCMTNTSTNLEAFMTFNQQLKVCAWQTDGQTNRRMDGQTNRMQSVMLPR